MLRGALTETGDLGGRHSTEVPFILPTKPSRVRFSHLTAGNFEPLQLRVVLMEEDFANAVSGEGLIISTTTNPKNVR